MPESNELTCETRRQDDAVIVTPNGDVDLSRSPVLRGSLMTAQADNPKRLIVDLTGVDYMDSSGVATLVEAMQNARKNRTTMYLCGMKQRVRSIFEIARLDSVFEIVPTIEHALDA